MEVRMEEPRMEKFIAIPKDTCFLFHRWKLKYDKNFNKYYVCKDCGARKIEHPDYAFSVRMNWLDGSIKIVKERKENPPKEDSSSEET